MQPRPDVSVIVVSYNTRALLAACLRSIPTGADGVSYEVFVVDNASSDGSPEMVAEQFPSAKLIHNDTNRGFAAANNQALRLAHGRYCLLLNSDAQPLPRSISAFTRFMDAHPSAGICGGQVLNPDRSFQASFNDFPTWFDELLMLTSLSRWVLPRGYPSYPESQSQEVRSVDWVGGAFLCARRVAIASVGLLDEDYFMYGEEMDWCYRMHQSGWGVFYLPEARALHWGGGSARQESERRRAQLYRSKWLFMRKHTRGAAAPAYRLAVHLLAVLKLAAWWPATICGNAGLRQCAAREVHSYRLVLGAT